MKSELEDRALRVLHPEVYYQLEARRSRRSKNEREQYIQRRQRRARQAARGAPASSARSPAGRSTSTRSTRRCSSQNLLYEQIYDLVAFRIIVDSRARVLRGARRRAQPLEAGAGPLQGLHRDAQGERLPVAAHHGDRPVRRAHGGADPHAARCTAIAEHGIAAHWKYKGGGRHRPAGRAAASRGCASCSSGSSSSRIRTSSCERCKERPLPRRGLRVHAQGRPAATSRRARRVIDFAYAVHSRGRHTTARARASTASSCRCATSCRAATRSRSSPPRARRRRGLAQVRHDAARQGAASAPGSRSSRRRAAWSSAARSSARDLRRHRLDFGKLRKRDELERVAKELGVQERRGADQPGRLRQADRAPGAREARARDRAGDAAGEGRHAAARCSAPSRDGRTRPACA